MKNYLLLFMFLAHIIDDFYLQGILAKLKQKKWWEDNAPNEKYKNDYKVGLIVHSLSWAIILHLPIIFLFKEQITLFIGISIPINAFFHGFIDNLKANKLKINLCEDQIYHSIQINLTYIILHLTFL